MIKREIFLWTEKNSRWSGSEFGACHLAWLRSWGIKNSHHFCDTRGAREQSAQNDKGPIDASDQNINMPFLRNES